MEFPMYFQATILPLWGTLKLSLHFFFPQEICYMSPKHHENTKLIFWPYILGTQKYVSVHMI